MINKNSIRNLKYFLYLTFFFVVCVTLSVRGKELQNPEAPIMAVFIHGSVGSLMNIPLLEGMSHLGLEEDLSAQQVALPYEYVSNSVKDNHRGYYMFHQPLRDFGLAPFDPQLLDTTPGHLSLGTFRIAATLKKMHELIPDHTPPSYHFYTFGWPGEMNLETRRLWGKLLYDALYIEKERLSLKLGCEVKIQIFTHSHGGNVALYLKEEEDIRKLHLCINKLIMFGCPVQEATSSYIYADIFERIIHVYSPSDYVQITDLFSSGGLSYRTFTQGEDTLLPSKLTQVQVHIDDTAPGHAQLWFIGLSPVFYSSSLSIYPLPMVSFTPLIMDVIDKYKEKPHIALTFKKDQDCYKIKVGNAYSGSYIGSCHYRLTGSFHDLVKKQITILQPYYDAISSIIKKYLIYGGIAGFGVGIMAKCLKSRKS